MDAQIDRTLASLQSRHLHALYAENCAMVRLKILDLIPPKAVVGIGDSATLRQVGIVDALKERGTRVINPFKHRGVKIDPKDAQELHTMFLRESTLCDVFMTGTNAVTQDGRLVNVDGAGNRVSGMVWGHPLSVIVVGKNKIVGNLDEAFHRVRDIVSPNHIRIRSVELGGKKKTTPCAVTGECSDCRASDRACNIFTIIEGKPLHTDIHVIVVDEDLGLSWDPSWPTERVARIIENYKQFAWITGTNYL